MTTTDPRAWLAEALERASKATEGPWYGAAGNQYVYGVTPGDEVGRFNRPADARFAQHSRTEHPAMAAALVAVLDLCDDWEARAPGVSGPEVFRRTITDELATDHPAQSERR